MPTEVTRSIGCQMALLRKSDVDNLCGPSAKVKIQNQHGLHARPAAAIVRALASLSAEVSITFRKKTANAKSVLGLLMLGVPCGSSILIRTSGQDASLALQIIEELIRKQFYEGDI